MEPLPSDAISEAGTFPIVCLCGSAGALPGYTEILQHVSASTGMAFIVVSHRATQNTDLLLRLLSRETKMSVVEVEHEMCIEPNRVFLSPPHQEMITDGSRLYLQRESKPEGWPILITVFLRSLARLGGSRAIALVLSGMSDDGSAALGELKASGGAVIAQSNPWFDEMSSHAIATGYVDRILSAAEMGRHLSRINFQPGMLF